jgi:hypothetical protein
MDPLGMLSEINGKAARGWRRATAGSNNVNILLPRGTTQSYDIIATRCHCPLLPAAARHRPHAALFCASTIEYWELF